MITIIVETEKEFEEMLEASAAYVCRDTSFEECFNHNHNCRGCYDENHIRAGIRIIPPENLGGEQ